MGPELVVLPWVGVPSIMVMALRVEVAEVREEPVEAARAAVVVDGREPHRQWLLRLPRLLVGRVVQVLLLLVLLWVHRMTTVPIINIISSMPNSSLNNSSTMRPRGPRGNSSSNNSNNSKTYQTF